MQRILYIVSVLVLFSMGLMAQSGIDFYPKILQNELSKIDGKSVELLELPTHSEIARQILLGKLYFAPDVSAFIKYVYVGRVNTCRTGVCSVSTNLANEMASEYFDYFILYDSACSIQLVRIFNYQATHGQEVTAKSWLKQFQGYQGNTELTVGKNIDAISGATISVDACIGDVEHKTGLLKQMVEKPFDFTEMQTKEYRGRANPVDTLNHILPL